MSNPKDGVELKVCKDAGIDLMVVWDSQIEECREIAPHHLYEERVAARSEFNSEVTKKISLCRNQISMHPNEKEKFLEALDKEFGLAKV